MGVAVASTTLPTHPIPLSHVKPLILPQTTNTQLGYYLSLTDTEASIREVGAAGALLFRPLGGFEAGVAALLVAIKQLIPDNEVALLGGALRFRAQVRRGEGGWQCSLCGREGGGWRARSRVGVAQRGCTAGRLKAAPLPPPALQHLPSLYALAATAGSLALGGAVRCIPMALAGTYWGWAYLRFAQLHEGGR